MAPILNGTPNGTHDAANGHTNGDSKRAIRIAGASGGFSDRQRAFASLAACDVDCIIGDWMSECTMTLHGAEKVSNQKNNVMDAAGLYDPTFMENLRPALATIQEKGIKIAVNAGASDTEKLAKLVEKTIKDEGLDLKVGWVGGDEVTDVVNRLLKQGEKFENICTGGTFDQWGFDPICAQCYLGGAGVAECLRNGADIVICGRVADAAPVIGAAMWWHGWDREKDLDSIAGALIAGHLLECSAYVCGGYYSGFKDLMDNCENIGFPIGEVNADGSVLMTKEPGTGGEMSVGTCTSQLLYEIQGPRYFGSDVVALLEGVKMEQVGKDRVLVSGVKGQAPPVFTKVGITAFGGYQAEFHYYICGLDLEDKCEWTERQIRYSIGEENMKKIHCLKFMLNGYCPENPRNQDIATVDFRIFIQTKDPNLVSKGTLDVPGFNRMCMENFLQSCPGASLGNDQRQSQGKEYYEYWVALLPQKDVEHKAYLPWQDKAVDIPVAPNTIDYPTRQWSYDTKEPVDLDSFGPTVRGPLGWIAMGRSGDKASDANTGFFVRHDDEWDWLRSLLTIEKIKQMLDLEYHGGVVERFEIPGIRAVHFLLVDHLDRGFNACSTYDTLGKNVCEYLRAKHVDIPTKFLRRGRI
ncbi:hypothetical protein W97_06973 [Coniosporium apollinis CBS 100218]|uniref:DUF1446 domain-containing protein n=1 Tax=Coniosporium apollinis (strain CBS 100218) TaxID=1168221 RepID=R7Z0A5_CONA1|nr:uncharacterized protein W97_06973 [Coniosporium apollinis CBS 100218]EON67605.1 hypothetical protein W97_06973 [Coniosporium apollinis CBS 100218]